MIRRVQFEALTLLVLAAGLSLACAARETTLGGLETGLETTSGPGMTESDGADPPDQQLSCSVLDQDCPAGQKCSYLDHETPLTGCVEVSGFWPVGDACTWKGNGVDDCDADSMCWHWWSNPDLEGRCVSFCTDTPEGPGCADGKACGPEGFYLCADVCDVFVQNCPAGQKCVPYPSDGSPYFSYEAYKCVDVGGDRQPGEPCESDGVANMNDDCALGGFCVGPAPEGGPFSGECVGMCTGSPDEPICPPGQICDLWGQGGPWVCETTCDPLADDCGPGEACYLADGFFHCIFTTQDIPLGEPCGYVNDCTAGALCADASVLPECNGAACCTPFCNLLDPDCSDLPGTECAALFEPGQAPVGSEHIGLCVAPP